MRPYSLLKQQSSDKSLKLRPYDVGHEVQVSVPKGILRFTITKIS